MSMTIDKISHFVYEMCEGIHGLGKLGITYAT